MEYINCFMRAQGCAMQKEYQQLKDGSARLKAIVETVPDGIITINAMGIIETVNPAVLKMFGYEEEELLGQNVKVLMPNPYQTEHDHYLANYRETGEKKVIGIGREVVAKRKDGSTFPIELAVSEMKVSGEQMFTGIIRNISEVVNANKQSLELQNRNKAILDTVIDGIITINKYGLIDSVNPATERIFGYSSDEMIGQNVKMLMPNPYKDKHDGYLANYQKTGERHIIGIGREVEGQRKNGTTFPLELSVSEMLVDGEEFFTGIVRDITERKEAEKMKEEFISTVSHELRTPLTSIRGSIGLLTGAMSANFDEQASKLLNIAQNNTERLLMLINDILDLSKIESGKMDFHFANVDVDALLKDAIQANEGYATQHNVEFQLESHVDGAFVYGDEHRLMQVMNNLMSNASKFAPEGDRIIISAVKHARYIRISVTDHGDGIPKELESSIFEKFTQADSSDTRKVGGTGLGLNITKAIVEKHNGQINFISEVGVGTTFYFDLPEVFVHQLESDDVETVRLPSHKILICEDEPDIASLLRLMLAQAGFDSDTASSAKEAQDMLATNDYDAMTLDIMLPDKSGIDLYGDIRKQKINSQLPIVFVSAKANQAKLKVGNSLSGIVEWINKPIESGELIEAIESGIANTKSGRKKSILHVEDDGDIRSLISILLNDRYSLIQANSLDEARQKLNSNKFDLVLLDVGLPDGSGLELVGEIRAMEKSPEILIFSADDMKHGKREGVAGSLIKSKTTNADILAEIEKVISQSN